jgi:hypothetical protein
VNSSLEIMHARYVLGLLPPAQVRDFAFEALTYGYDGELLRALASLRTPTQWEADRIFYAAIREMGFDEYSNKDACRVLIDDTVRRIMIGELDAVIGATEIRECWKRSGYMEELRILAAPLEILLCTGRRDDAIRLDILHVVAAHQASANTH